MFYGTNLSLISDLALVSIQVKLLGKKLGIIRHKYVHLGWSGAYTRALENQQDVSPTFTHRRMKCMCGSGGGEGGRVSGPPSKITKIRVFLAILVPISLKS